MTWPVAKPGYWVDGNDPSQVRACKESLGSCPGSMLYGVGSAAWMRRGDVGIAVKGAIGVPDEACLIEYGSAKPPLGCPIVRCHEGDETNKTLDEHTFHFDCSSSDGPDAPCVDADQHIPRDDCFNSIKHIKRGEFDTLYQLRQDKTIQRDGVQIRCLDKVGSRCCPGNKGSGCVRCCNKENFGIAKTKEGTLYNQRNCDNMLRRVGVARVTPVLSKTLTGFS
jgi:hypothetical protein